MLDHSGEAGTAVNAVVPAARLSEDVLVRIFEECFETVSGPGMTRIISSYFTNYGGYPINCVPELPHQLRRAQSYMDLSLLT